MEQWLGKTPRQQRQRQETLLRARIEAARAPSGTRLSKDRRGPVSFQIRRGIIPLKRVSRTTVLWNEGG
jgi:hypothetical protein